MYNPVWRAPFVANLGGCFAVLLVVAYLLVTNSPLWRNTSQPRMSEEQIAQMATEQKRANELRTWRQSEASKIVFKYCLDKPYGTPGSATYEGVMYANSCGYMGLPYRRN
jgi:hypothetical protein